MKIEIEFNDKELEKLGLILEKENKSLEQLIKEEILESKRFKYTSENYELLKKIIFIDKLYKREPN